MTLSTFSERRFSNRHGKLLHSIVWICSSLLALTALVLPISTRPSAYTLSPGDVAPQDIQAPYSLAYPSEILTEQARQDAEQLVPAVFLPADPAITRKQIERLRTVLNYISVVRLDTFSTIDQKLSDLTRLNDIVIQPDDANYLLELNDVRWEAIQREALAVLESVMRDTIRDDQVRDATRRIPTLISFTLQQDQAAIVGNLVTPFIVPNSLFDQAQTGRARLEARDAAKPVTKEYIAGETIIRRGQIITPLAWEALSKFSLIRPQTSSLEYLSALALVIVISGFTIIFIQRRRPQPLDNLRSHLLIVFLFMLFLFAARLVIPNRTVVPYLFPLPAFGLTIAVLFNLELGLVLSLILSILTAFGLPNSLDLTVFYILSSSLGVLALGKGQRISTFLWAGLTIGAAGSIILLAYRLTSPTTDLLGLATLIVAAFLNGMASASLSLLLQYIFAQVIGVTTTLQLLEISRPDHPLLQFILQNAPGSYQHSLQVSVLAEQAAEKIGADAMLVRVGGLYHDAGKALNPSFFIENQIGPKLNPHDDIDPAVSAQTIIQHVTNGVALARKYRLPSRIQDFIREHHGTLLTRYQYTRAVEAAGNVIEVVDINLFRYPGPIPGTKETALLMLADGCQARVRAELPQTEEDIRAVIRKVIDYCEKEGQLDETRLTLRDLSVITNSFVDTLKNTYHPRIRYPELSPNTKPQSELESNTP